MMRKAMARWGVLLLGTLVAVLSGCENLPVSKSLRKQAKPVTLAQVRANPAVYRGTVVIWGGKVIQTVNDTNGGALYILQFPLTHYEAPMLGGVSTGRFIARSNGYIDPEVFTAGRLVTVAGRITGTVTEPLGKVLYVYPDLTIEELHLWQAAGPVYYYPAWYSGWYGPGWGWGWGGGWYGPGWDWGWYAPAW